jgi:hypothetical protein
MLSGRLGATRKGRKQIEWMGCLEQQIEREESLGRNNDVAGKRNGELAL